MFWNADVSTEMGAGCVEVEGIPSTAEDATGTASVPVGIIETDAGPAIAEDATDDASSANATGMR